MSNHTKQWVSLNEAMRRMSCSRPVALKVIESGLISTIQLPGGTRKLLAADVDQLVKESTKGSTKEAVCS